MKTIGENIRELRKSKGMTLEDVGKFLHVGRSNVSKYERGEISVPYNKIIALSNLFQVTPGYLMGWETKDRTRETELLVAFEKLNADGREKVINYIYDLAEMPKYTINP